MPVRGSTFEGSGGGVFKWECASFAWGQLPGGVDEWCELGKSSGRYDQKSQLLLKAVLR